MISKYLEKTEFCRSIREQPIFFLSISVLIFLLNWRSLYGPDIFYHLNLGRLIFESGDVQPSETFLMFQPTFVNIYWLFQIIIYSIFKVANLYGLASFFSLIWICFFWNSLTWIQNSKKDFSLTFYFFIIFSIIVTSLRFEERPEVLTYFLILISLKYHFHRIENFESSATKKYFIIQGLIQILLSNIHGYFGLNLVLSLFIYPTFIFFLTIKSSKYTTYIKQIFIDWIVLLCVQIFASLINPFGINIFFYFNRLGKFLVAFKDRITEFEPFYKTIPNVWILYVPILYIFLLISFNIYIFRKKKSLELTSSILSIFGVIMGILSYRNIPLIYLFSIPMLRFINWDFFKNRSFLKINNNSLIYYLSIIILTTVFTWAITTSKYYASIRRNQYFKLEADPSIYPVNFVHKISSYMDKAKIFNHSTDGGFLQFFKSNLFPYSDSRFVDIKLVSEYFEALENPESTWKLHRRHYFDGILVNLNHQSEMFFSISSDKSLRLSYVDTCRALFTRKDTTLDNFFPSEKISISLNENLNRSINKSCIKTWLKAIKEFDLKSLGLLFAKEIGKKKQIDPFYYIIFSELNYQIKLPGLKNEVSHWESKLHPLNNKVIRKRVLKYKIKNKILIQ